jgi:hypothetical protein
MDIQTMRKSSLDQLSLRYAFSPTMNPLDMILRILSQMKMQLKAISIFLKMTAKSEFVVMYVSMANLSEDKAITMTTII